MVSMQLGRNLDGRVTDVFMHPPGSECKVAREAGYAFIGMSAGELDDWLAEAGEGYASIARAFCSQGARVHVLSELLGAHKAELEEKLSAIAMKAGSQGKVSPRNVSEYLDLVRADAVLAFLAGIHASPDDYSRMSNSAAMLLPKPYAYRAAEFFALADGSAVLTPPRSPLKGEYSLWSFALGHLYLDKVVALRYPASGTDFVRVGRALFMGYGCKTSEEAAHEVFWEHRSRIGTEIGEFVFVDLGMPGCPSYSLSTLMVPANNGNGGTESRVLCSAGISGNPAFAFDRSRKLEKFNSLNDYFQSRGFVAIRYGK
ncbi:hypothetical protein HY640_05285 [Candidatus Woesearchaeota archaeon]|nr:hypothetical protein [Candidatus Woesearchaeota archaeon]